MPYSHFTLEDRDALQILVGKELSMKEIAVVLGKHPSAVYRELDRNSRYGCYVGHFADRLARARRRLGKTSPKSGNMRLMASVERFLEKDVSPEQIAGRIRLEHPEDHSWHISHETIYKYIYAQRTEHPDLISHLRQGRRKRKKRGSSKGNRGMISGRVSIDERPPIVEMKTRRGDWEGDTIEGKGRRGYAATFTDRKSKYLIAYKLTRKTAKDFTTGALHAFSGIDPKLIRTITLDNGKENALHKTLSAGLGAKVYFAHAYHSWERGLNEHTNGLLRQYLPKSMSMNLLHHRTLDKYVRLLNNRPRKALGYRTPHEVFFGLPVALQD